MAQAAGAAVSLDTRELSRALTVTSERDARPRSSSFGWVYGPVSAIVTGDMLVTLRARRQVIAIVVSTLVPIVVTLAGWPTWTVVLALLGAGYAAALSSAEGPRRAEMAPVLDRSLPIEASSVRRARLLWPTAVTCLWSAVTIGLWASRNGLAIWPWLLLAVVAGPVFAAGALRGAYRAPTDWSRPLLVNPYGPPIPPGLFSTFSRGPDIVVICLIPMILGVVAVATPATLFPWQLAATFVALAIAAHVPKPGGLLGGATR